LRTQTIPTDPEHPEPDPIHKAASVILSGGILGFPTDTTYGLGVNPFDDGAVSKVYRLKQREHEKPLILLMSSLEQLDNLAQEVSEDAKKLMDHFWPGPLTLIFTASEELKSFSVGNSGKVGVRIPNNLIAKKLIDACRIPVTATSANISGQPSARSAQEVIDYFGNHMDLVLDGGHTQSNTESTVLDLTSSSPSLIRVGQIEKESIEAILGHNL
jgi:L-threonylcarbamoyladenylate synthase